MNWSKENMDAVKGATGKALDTWARHVGVKKRHRNPLEPDAHFRGRILSGMGVKDDTGKTRWDLVPVLAEEEIARVLTYGAGKYAADNWRNVPEPVRRYYSAMRRHVQAWRRGEMLDPETGLHHLAHAATCLVFLVEMDLEKKVEKKS